MKKFLFLALFASLALVSCKQQSTAWTGFYYASGSSEDGVEIQEFETEEACTEWTETQMSTATLTDAHAHCGYQCSYDSEGQYVCAN